MEDSEKQFNHDPQVAKQRQWTELAAKVELVTDGLGKTIDTGIKEAVIGLNVFEINTTGSCEGHDNWGTGGPYIDVESLKNVQLDTEWQLVVKKEEPDEERLEILRREITRNNLEERKKLINLLEEFYRNREVPFSIRLIIRPFGMGWSRIESQGVELQEIESDEAKKKEILQTFQIEMQAFTEFVKNKFFQE